MEESKEASEQERPVRKKRSRLRDNLLWVILTTMFFYIILGDTAAALLRALLLRVREWSPAMTFILEYYTLVLGDILVLILILLLGRRDRFILRSYLPKGTREEPRILVLEDRFQAPQNNTPGMLFLGLLLGFLTNFACIVCALAHGDIKLYLDFQVSQIPVLLFAFLSVFIQSTGEELWCRGFMYERLSVRYPRLAAILINGIFFGLLHCFNPGASVLAIVGIVICGLSYSLVRWYTGSIWIVMGIHTMWNFTQNFLFGLPNSGLVSQVSVFHLEAASGISNLIYNYEFGVEAAIPALVADGLVGVVVLILAIRNGRIKELGMSYEKTLCAETGRSLEELEREEAEMPAAHPLLDHTVLTGLIVAGISLLIQVILTVVGTMIPAEASYLRFLVTVGELLLVLLIMELIFKRLWFSREFDGTLPGKIGQGLMYLIPLILLDIGLFVFERLRIGGEMNDVLHILSLSLTAGITEEIAFRSYYLANVMRVRHTRGRMIAAVLLSSVVFGGIHMMNLLAGAELTITLVQVAVAFSTGLVLAAVYLRCGSILPCMLFHAFHDVLNLLFEKITEAGALLQAPDQIILIENVAFCAVALVTSAVILIPRSQYEKIRDIWDKKWRMDGLNNYT